MSKGTLTNRHELLFLYDAKFINPNGDPADENRPRVDEHSSRNIVTDVRLKRTIRDYLHDFKGHEIFIREIKYEGEKIQDAKMRFMQFLEPFKNKKLTLSEALEKGSKEIIENCIDIRLFGALIPVELKKNEKSALVLIGPTQFKMGHSLHKVEVKYIQGTGAFASGEGKRQKTFREEYVLPYSLIAFYGVVNENAAKDTMMSDADLDALVDAMWNGTKNLLTRTKVGQLPHLLLDVVYSEGNFHLGDLDHFVSIASDKDDLEIREPADYKVQVGPLFELLTKAKDKIQKIRIANSERLSFIRNEKDIDIVEEFKKEGFDVEHLKF